MSQVVTGATTKPRFTSASSATAVTGTAFSFILTAAGVPAPVLSETGTLPAGLTFAPGTGGTAAISGAPAANSGGRYRFTVSASNASGTATETFTLSVDQTPAITSPNSVTATVGKPLSVKVTTTGYPLATVTESGVLPAGVTFTGGTKGTATFAGKPAAGSAGFYDLTLAATNGVGTPVTQAFVLTVNQIPGFTSPSSTTATVGTPVAFDVTTTGAPASTVSESGTLPTGVVFTAQSGGTATLTGTPAAETGGSYKVTLKASNAVGTATQTFTLTVDQPPGITSAATATATVHRAFSFKVTSSGYPIATVSESGVLPAGLTFSAGTKGTAAISGTPTAGDTGTYDVTVVAANGVGTATQMLVIAVKP